MKISEPLVPLEDLYQLPNLTSSGVSYGPGGTEPPDHLERTYGVSVVLDHRDRPAVSFSDACLIRDSRKAAAEKLQAEFLAETQQAARVAGWQRSRETYWRLNRLRVGREIGPGIAAAEHLAEINRRLSVEVLAAENAAGIPEDVQRRLTWPSPMAWTDPDRGTDLSYKAPEE